jgi:predicted PhzF superfamily epimerase YddE/YHI9
MVVKSFLDRIRERTNMQLLPLFQVDAFTDQPFTGNPAAVVLLRKGASVDWMLKVAQEMNLSETAFVYPKADLFSLRWFTPRVEVELCGHATLSAAHVLWETRTVPHGEAIRFSTLSGVLGARRVEEVNELDFPAGGLLPAKLPAGVIAAVGGTPVFSAVSGEKWLLEYATEKEIWNLTPDFNALMQIKGRGLIVTSRADRAGVDFVSRYFAPWIGINEDPVTGSAHTILGPFWGVKLGKQKMVAHQVSARGGVVHVRLAGDRVYIGGKAITVVKGALQDLGDQP